MNIVSVIGLTETEKIAYEFSNSRNFVNKQKGDLPKHLRASARIFCGSIKARDRTKTEEIKR